MSSRCTQDTLRKRIVDARLNVSTTVERTYYLALFMFAALVRLLIAIVDPHPLLMADSESYLRTAKEWWISAVRPAGTGLFYRVLLLGHNDVRIIVLAQSALGVATTLLWYRLGRALHVPPLASFLAAALISIAPSTLLFERAVLSESLATFAVALFLLAVTRAQAHVQSAPWLLAGVVAGGSGLVRSALLVFVPMSAIVAVSHAAGRRRWVLPVLALLGAAGPLVAYAILVRVAFGSFGITFLDGISLFSLHARATDCADPSQPPPLRRVLCRDPTLLARAPHEIVWAQGPVQDAIRRFGWPRANSELRTLAIENIARAPGAALSGVVERLADALSAREPAYVSSPADSRLPSGSGGDYLIRRFTGWAAASDAHAWNTALWRWYAIRWTCWIGLVAATIACRIGPPRAGREGIRAVTLITFGTVVTTAAVVYTTPRLLVPLEGPAVLSCAWLVSSIIRSRCNHVGSVERLVGK